MAAPIDLTSATTAEGQALQLAYALSNAENAQVDTAGAALTDNIQITPNNETGVIAVTMNLPVTIGTSANGATYVASEFIA